ncbi:MAG: transposase [Pseudanabaena sp. Salubria-1]|nr:transposase [Pseudanabaena sp. Salubria-1]
MSFSLDLLIPLNPEDPQTNRFAEMIVQQVLHSDMHNVGKQNDLTDEEVWSMIKYISEKKLRIDLKPLKRLGIDEIALRKGQGDYIVVLVDLDRKIPIGFVRSRKQEEIRKELEGWGKEVLEQIIEVSMDLSLVVQKNLKSVARHRISS